MAFIHFNINTINADKSTDIVIGIKHKLIENAEAPDRTFFFFSLKTMSVLFAVLELSPLRLFTV